MAVKKYRENTDKIKIKTKDFGAYSVVQLDKLVPYSKNARTHSPEQIKQIAASIAEFGFTNPLLIDEDNNLIAGHGRCLAAQELGMLELPAIILKGLSESQRRALILADNKLALNAGWDNDLLRAELQALVGADFNVSVVGFDDEELKRLLAEGTVGETDPDSVPDLPLEPVTVTGDVWRLGKHRLLCGDATLVDNVKKLMAGELAECLWTDPPYNVAYEGSAGKIKNDDMTDQSFLQFLSDAFVCAFTALKEGGAAYIAHADTEGFNFRNAFKLAGFKTSGCLIWRKNSLVLGRSDYQWQHEPILYGWKPGKAHRWYGGRKKTTMIELAETVPAYSKIGEDKYQINIGMVPIIVEGKDLKVYNADPSVISEDRPLRNAEHPTMKPVALIERFLENSTRKTELVLDLFGGSGSTLIASDKNARVCYTMELDPRFCDVIVKRWQAFSGKKATLEGSTDTFAVIEKKRGVTNVKKN